MSPGVFSSCWRCSSTACRRRKHETGAGMNGYQRIAAALKGEWPDTTPVMLHNFMHAAREAGVTMREFRSDPETIARSFLLAVERYEYDGILVDVDTVTLAAAAGVPVDRPEDEPARAMNGAIRS